ncbi:hypothetical protein ACD661_00980 [Legionella lytica]|uniref:Uncharacterized protein n=1 Tax=Legionella lytica TaxID=96232 RepID=A0ABW8D350_9GAMM
MSEIAAVSPLDAASSDFSVAGYQNPGNSDIQLQFRLLNLLGNSPSRFV